MQWNWDFTLEILPRMLWATGNTLIAALVGYLIAVAAGLVFLLLQRTPYRPINVATREFVEFTRSTPLVVQLFFVYFVAPQFGVVLSAWTAAMITIGIHFGTYLSEVYRGALEAVPRAQWEACRALNLTPVKSYRRIILPQALPAALPGMGNYLVGIFKDTPLLSTIGVAELMHTANALGAETYRYLEPYTMVGFIFLMISLPTASLLRRLERYVARAYGLSERKQ
jgi:polar amino acid transport system permease protein